MFLPPNMVLIGFDPSPCKSYPHLAERGRNSTPWAGWLWGASGNGRCCRRALWRKHLGTETAALPIALVETHLRNAIGNSLGTETHLSFAQTRRAKKVTCSSPIANDLRIVKYQSRTPQRILVWFQSNESGSMIDHDHLKCCCTSSCTS